MCTGEGCLAHSQHLCLRAFLYDHHESSIITFEGHTQRGRRSCSCFWKYCVSNTLGNSLLLSFLNTLSITRTEDRKPLCKRSYLQVGNNLYFCILKNQKLLPHLFREEHPQVSCAWCWLPVLVFVWCPPTKHLCGLGSSLSQKPEGRVCVPSKAFCETAWKSHDPRVQLYVCSQNILQTTTGKSGVQISRRIFSFVFLLDI